MADLQGVEHMASRPRRPAGSCCCWRRHNEIVPDAHNEENWKIIEIRPRRFLRVIHINPRSRDEKFAKEMQMYAMYQKQGLPSNNVVLSAGPLSLPPKKPQGSAQNHLQYKSTQTVRKTSVERKNSANVSSTPVDSSPRSYVQRHESLSVQSAGIRSASNVIVGVPTLSETVERANLQSPRRKSATPRLSAEDNHPFRSSLDIEEDTAAEKLEEYLVNRPRTPAYCSPPADMGTVIFFIHGVGGSADVWKAQMSHFGDKGYEVVALDLIGHGYSSAPQNAGAYHFDEIVSDTQELFDRFCKRKNVVIGHSYGCSFASVLARKRSRRVTKLVMISGGGPTPLSPQPGIFSLPICLLACFRPCVECRYKRSAFSSKRKPIMPPEDAFNVPTYVLRHTMNGQCWPDGDEFFHNWLMCPTLLIYGLKDELVTLQEEEDMADTIYQSQLEVIADASHMVMIEAPEEVNRLIENFMQEMQRQGTVLELHDHSLDRSRPSLRAKSAKSTHSIEPNSTSNSRVFSPKSLKSGRRSTTSRR